MRIGFFSPNHDDQKQVLKPKHFASWLNKNCSKPRSRRELTSRSQFPEQCLNKLMQLLNCVYEKWNLETRTTPKELPFIPFSVSSIKCSTFASNLYCNLYLNLKI